MKAVITFAVCMVCLGVIHSAPTASRHRQKRGFRASVSDRIAHGFGKRGLNLYNTDDVLSELDILKSPYISQDDRNSFQGIPVQELANEFQKDPGALLGFLGAVIDQNGDGSINEQEFFHENYNGDM